MEVQLHTFLTSILAGRKLSPSRHRRFTSATRLYKGTDRRQENYATVWRKDKTLVPAGNWTPFLRPSIRSKTKILYSASEYDQRISGSASACALKPQLTIHMFSRWLKRFVMKQIQPANAQLYCSGCIRSYTFRLCSCLHSRYNKSCALVGCISSIMYFTGWSKSLCAPDDCIITIRCTQTFWSSCTSTAANPRVKIKKFHCTASLSGNS